MPSVYIKTYGCQMNERDSEQVARSLVVRGYRLVDDETQADVILLNTCSVRDMAEQKAIGKMGMLQRLREKRPHLVLGYLGCMAQSRGAELLSSPARVDLVVGTQKFHRVADYVDELVRRRSEDRIDDERLPIRRCGRRARFPIGHPRPSRRRASNRVRFDHARLQHALCVLHRPANARNRAESLDRRYCQRGSGLDRQRG